MQIEVYPSTQRYYQTTNFPTKFRNLRRCVRVAIGELILKSIQTIAAEVQLFNTVEKKEEFLFVLGALTARLISLKKAAEILSLEPEAFLKILDLMGIEFSYLTEDDLATERTW